MICLSGGLEDPNIASLYQVLEEKNALFYPFLVGEEHIPELFWDLSADRLIVDGVEIRPTALFIRQDVFAALRHPTQHTLRRSQVWFEVLHGWALAHEEMILLNRHHQRTNKLAVLVKAAQLGLNPPYTVVSNQLPLLQKLDGEVYISKPVPGGDHTRLLVDALQDPTLLEIPTTVQPCLIQPEMRIYGIGGEWIAFWMQTASLDYRVHQDVEVVQTEPPMEVVGKLAELMAFMRLDFAAADLKTDPETGELRFLEINSSPMFAKFDRASDFAVSKAIVQALRHKK